MTITSVSRSDSLPPVDFTAENDAADLELQVIDVASSPTGAGPSTLRVVDPRAASKKADALGALAGVDLSEETRRRLALSCVELGDFHVTRHRVNTGWLSMVEYRQYVTMFTLTPSNDRLGDLLIYAADPSFAAKTLDDAGRRIGHIAVPMPESDGIHAQLVYTATKSTLLEATDRNCLAVLRANRQQDIGADIIHRPLTSVFTTLRFTDSTGETEQVTVDGNSRLASAYAQIEIDPAWLPTRLRKNYESQRPTLMPSMLMECTLTERRDLTRRIIKSAEDRLAVPPTGTSKDLRERNAAVCTLNALTAPVQVIVGYEDDDPGKYGKSRFASAVRSLLVRMNVGVKTFETGAQNAVLAEEVVLAAHQAGWFDDDDTALLIGREDIAGVVEGYGLDPTLRDQRAMMVVSLCSRNVAPLNKALREKHGKPRVDLKQRSAVISELALRSYGAVLSPADLDRCRTALNSVCVWQSLVDKDWEPVVLNTDGDIDLVLKAALVELQPVGEDEVVTGKPGPYALVLGVVGMFALVVGGALTSPKGSSEREVGEAIDRSGVGSIIDKLTTFPWGLRLLAENIKRHRAGVPLLGVQVPDGTTTVEFYDDPKVTVSARDARLRQAVRIAVQGRSEKTAASAEENAFSEMCRRITNADEAFQTYRAIRSNDPSPSRLPFEMTEAPIKQLEAMAKALNRMTAEADDE